MGRRSANLTAQSGTLRQRWLVPVLVAVLVIAAALLALMTVQVCLAKQRGPVCLSSPAAPGEWSLWGMCDVACGEGNQTRTRVKPAESESSQPAVTVAEVKSCFVPGKCNEIYRWLSWTEWSSCTKTCGPGGAEIRSRQCQTYENVPADVSKCKGGDGLRRDCVTQPPCPVSQVVHWTLWSTWTSCTKACGPNGTQYRTRECWTDENVAVDVGHCQGHNSQTQSCNSEFTCAVSYHYWTQWAPWTWCTNSCGGGGTKMRGRQCLTNANITADVSNCPGDSGEVQMCNRLICPPEWSTWTSWSDCNQQSCMHQRLRSCIFNNIAVSPSVCRGWRETKEKTGCYDGPTCSRRGRR